MLEFAWEVRMIFWSSPDHKVFRFGCQDKERLLMIVQNQGCRIWSYNNFAKSLPPTTNILTFWHWGLQWLRWKVVQAPNKSVLENQVSCDLAMKSTTTLRVSQVLLGWGIESESRRFPWMHEDGRDVMMSNAVTEGRGILLGTTGTKYNWMHLIARRQDCVCRQCFDISSMYIKYIRILSKM